MHPLPIALESFYFSCVEDHHSVLEYLVPLYQQKIIEKIKVLYCSKNVYKFLLQEIDDQKFIDKVEYI